MQIIIKLLTSLESSGPVLNNPILENILLSLLLVKLASLADEALEEYIAQKGLSMPKTYRDYFNGRTNFLGDNSHLKDATRFHKLQKLRSELAHDPTGKAVWANLDRSYLKTRTTSIFRSKLRA